MISCSSILAVFLRYMRLYKHDYNLIFMILYWPLLDIMTWGFLGAWIQQSGVNQFSNYTLIALLGVLLWSIVGRGANIISLTLCEELWQNNLVNLFSLPIRLSEWIIGMICYFLVSILLTVICGIIAISLLYSVALYDLILNFALFAPPLILSAIWLGFTCLSVIIVLGRRGTELGFVTIWMLMPFSGAYYPIDILPTWAKTISSCIPMSYVFTTMRTLIAQEQFLMTNLIIGYVLSIAYALLAIMLFIYLFNRSRHQGLTRLTD